MVGLCPYPTSGVERAPLILSTPTARYVGHKNQKYKLDCCLSERDTHVVSCSEDGKVFFWDLVEVSLPPCSLLRASAVLLSCSKRALVTGVLSWNLWQRVDVCPTL